MTSILLLTSHAIRPPWDGGDKNMARLLLAGPTGVTYSYLAGLDDEEPWNTPHAATNLSLLGDIPNARDKLRLFRWLVLRPPRVDAVHLLVTFRSRRVQHALAALPLLRRCPLVVTCLTATNLPLRLIRRSRAVVTISGRTATALREAGVEGVVHIPPGVDLEWFRPESSLAGRPEARGSRPTLLFAGHFVRGGGLDEALRLTGRLRNRIPGLRLVVAMRRARGESQEWARTEIRRRSAVAGVTDLVDALDTVTDMRAVYHASSVVLFQPDNLGLKMELPMTLLEALACGKPIVVSGVPPLDELGHDGPAVTLGAPGDSATATIVERLLTDESFGQKAGKAARALAERRYCAGRMVAAYRDLYRTLA